MKLWNRRRQPIPGQSRPDGLHFERIPVHDTDAAEAGEKTRTVIEHDDAPPTASGELARLRADVAALAKRAAFLGAALAEITADRDLLSGVSAKRLGHIRALDAKLAAARHVMRGCGVGAALLATFEPPTEFGEGWRDEHPVTARPDRC